MARACRALAIVVLVAVFIGASYAATRPRPEPAPVGVPAAHPAADVVLECRPAGRISKRPYRAVYNMVPMTPPAIEE